MKSLLLFLCAAVLMVAPALAASVADGTWSTNQNGGGAPTNLVISSSGTSISGTASGLPILNGTISGNAIHFDVFRNGVSYTCKGTVSGNTLELYQTVTSTGGSLAHVTLTKSN